MTSLTRRLLLAASVVLVIFLGLTGYVLDQAFRHSAESAERDRLQGHVYALLAAADLQNGTLGLPRSLPEARFTTPNSGLYARIVGAHGEVVWSSPSMLGLSVPFATLGMPGAANYERLTAANGEPYYGESFTVVWDSGGGKLTRYSFQVTESLTSFLDQVNAFRRNLWGWLVGVAVLLLAVQGSILRWGLAPLRRVAADLEDVRAGERVHLDQDYPRELQGLTQSINTFIASERAQRDRYRNTLADLAHSLKTPLAVMHGVLGQRPSPHAADETLQDQVERMRQIVDYQLQRAATSGKSTFATPVSVNSTVQRIGASLDKVYASRGLSCAIKVDSDLTFRGDQGDLMEVVGNVLDNAYKWARSRVEVRAFSETTSEGSAELVICVDDDGPGIPADQRHAVLSRGVRADQTVFGHGIGLAVVRDILSAYDGNLTLDSDGKLGGARITLRFPHH